MASVVVLSLPTSDGLTKIYCIVDKLLNNKKSPISNDEIRRNKLIEHGKIFQNYEEFTEQFNSYCKETNQLFVITKSAKFDKEQIKFRVFKCIHHESVDNKVTRGANVNKLQSYNGCNCKSAFRINFNQRGPHAGLYKITSMVIDHNHEITQKAYMLHHSNRKLPANLKETAKEMLSVGARPSAVALKMTKKSGKIVIPKDLFNLLPRKKITESEATKLQSVIEKQNKIDGKNNFHYIQNEEGDEFYGLFYQNNRMKSLFKTYSSVTFIDGTYLLNQENFPVINFVVTDHNRQSRVVAFALVACERQITIRHRA